MSVSKKARVSAVFLGISGFWVGILAPSNRVRTRGLLEKGSFQTSPFSRDSRDPDPPFCVFFVSCAFLVSLLPSLFS